MVVAAVVYPGPLADLREGPGSSAFLWNLIKPAVSLRVNLETGGNFNI